MQNEVSRFQDRLAFVTGAATLLALSVRRRRPETGGIVLFALGGFLLAAGVDWLRPAGFR
jgi:hypothetical protein